MEVGRNCLEAMIIKTLTVAVMHNGNGRKQQEDACLMPGGILSGIVEKNRQIVSDDSAESDIGDLTADTIDSINSDDSTLEKRSGSDKSTQLFAVADGMGGHNIGDLASLTALEALQYEVDLYFKNVGKKEIDFAKLADNVSESVDRCVRQQLVAWQGMPVGTTLSWLLISKDSAYTMSIGHSRIYLFRQNKLFCVTRDHKTSGKSSRPDLYYGFRSDESRIIPDNLNRLPLQKGDILLLTTDGITNVLTDETIESVLSSPQAFVSQIHQLKDLSLASDSRDNMCVVAVRVQSVEATESKSDDSDPKPRANSDRTKWFSKLMNRFRT
jgi:protein phosphatase